ncbi:hypothetical protein H0I23_07855 [Cellulophaga sp. HaHaR_3_176]|uniref:hypothetical protein n=1 Tax=Cellulophaga sp. HaHaR_3_176 TaxID=1942464 RepID=UPI001C1FAA16|nr:hypothetical protein [Cellulophaga sp. HaHaR_3_176]QWX85542.1 hypothetical protein H0I23_07855 [Cellulophaga sp. HaHaR_3_176]
MKKTLLVLSLVIAGLTYSCKETKKDNSAAAKTETVEEPFSLIKDSTKVSFTAYKTTDKIPVGGIFKTINIKNEGTGATALEAMDGTEFSIPVSSLFTNDGTGTRDPKLLEFFFGVMDNTELISGIFNVDGDACSLEITLNGETGTIALETLKNSETKYTFTGVLKLGDWNALDAVASINKACEALHTGPDGVSKTWEDVAIEGVVVFEKK